MIVSIAPPKRLADLVVVPGGLKPETLHFTLAYLGKTEEISLEDYSKIMKACINATENQPPFEIRLEELGRFENVRSMTDPDGNVKPPEEPTDVIFLKGVSEDLHTYRNYLLKIMDMEGVQYSKAFTEFKPHMSLIYVPHDSQIDYGYSLPTSFMVEGIELWSDNDKYPIAFRR
jgi:2'-5' RNA ligase